MLFVITDGQGKFLQVADIEPVDGLLSHELRLIPAEEAVVAVKVSEAASIVNDHTDLAPTAQAIDRWYAAHFLFYYNDGKKIAAIKSSRDSGIAYSLQAAKAVIDALWAAKEKKQ